MLNPPAQDLEVWSGLRFGVPVERAAASLPATTAAPIFRVVGGRVAILAIIGQVTTVIQTQANNTKLISNPTTGTDLDICAVLDISADEVGCLYGITGVPADALIGANAGGAPMCLRPIVVPAGTIDLSCAATNTGAVKWQLRYLPLDPGAYVEAA